VTINLVSGLPQSTFDRNHISTNVLIKH